MSFGKYVILTTYFFIIFSNTHLFSQLPRGIFGLDLYSDLSIIKKNFNVKRVKSESSAVRTYKVNFVENENIEILLSFYDSKLYRIKVFYKNNTIDNFDWEEIYNQTLNNFGSYKNSITLNQNNKLIEQYFWEDPYSQYSISKVSENSNISYIQTVISDKELEHKVSKISKIKIFFLSLMNFFN